MDFWRFGIPADIGEPLEGHYDIELVLLSVLFASLASLAALSVVDRISLLQKQQLSTQRLWIVIGAFAMGSGIWAMHFTGMMAYHVPVAMSYGMLLTLISMIPGMLGAGFALIVMSRRRVNWVHVQTGGFMMAAGIGTMHYTGMEAMIMDAHMYYHFGLFVFSIIVAHILATTALYIRFTVSRAVVKIRLVGRVIGSIAMGCAVAGMHYTAMSAAEFYPKEHVDVNTMLLPPGVMVVGIAFVIFLITMLTILGTVIDIRLSEASDSVIDSATRYDKVLATMADGFAVIRSNHEIETLNAAARCIFYVEKPEALEQVILFDDLIINDDNNEDVLAYFDRTGDSYLLDYAGSIQGKRMNGVQFPVELALGKMNIRGENFYTCTFRDVSEKLAMEIQLTHAQKLESIGQLAAGIAHEVNTPTQYVSDNTRFLQDVFNDLNEPLTILTSLDLDEITEADIERIKAMRDAAEEADLEFALEEVPQAITQCLEGLERISKIVGAMKEFSHPATEKVSFDVNHAIESTVTVASNEWKYVATLELDLDPNTPLVICNPGDFNQAVLNIVVNAAHAIGDHREDENELGKITISSIEHDGWVEIRISDNGPGIPDNVKTKIFDPFFTTKGVGRGTGQGLSIAHNAIVKKYGGELNCETTVGEGTCFIIRLQADLSAGNSADAISA